MRLILAAGLSLLLAGSAQAVGIEMRIFDVLHVPKYRAAYERMVRGQPGLPTFMSTVRAAMNGSGSPGRTQIINGRPRQLFQFCEPHNCGHMAAVMFSADATVPAKAAVLTDNEALGPPSKGAIRYLGNPDPLEKQALSAALDN